MASNASHFVELARYWTDVSPVSVDPSSLSPRWHPSSTRRNFMDVSGRLMIHFSDGFDLDLDWTDSTPIQTWELSTLDGVIIYDEVSGIIKIDDNDVSRIPLMDFSDLVAATHGLGVTGLCGATLPLLGEVMPIHLMLTRAFAQQREISLGDKSGILPFS